MRKCIAMWAAMMWMMGVMNVAFAQEGGTYKKIVENIIAEYGISYEDAVEEEGIAINHWEMPLGLHYGELADLDGDNSKELIVIYVTGEGEVAVGVYGQAEGKLVHLLQENIAVNYYHEVLLETAATQKRICYSNGVPHQVEERFYKFYNGGVEINTAHNGYNYDIENVEDRVTYYYNYSLVNEKEFLQRRKDNFPMEHIESIDYLTYDDERSKTLFYYSESNKPIFGYKDGTQKESLDAFLKAVNEM